MRAIFAQRFFLSGVFSQIINYLSFCDIYDLGMILKKHWSVPKTKKQPVPPLVFGHLRSYFRQRSTPLDITIYIRRGMSKDRCCYFGLPSLTDQSLDIFVLISDRGPLLWTSPVISEGVCPKIDATAPDLHSLTDRSSDMFKLINDKGLLH